MIKKIVLIMFSAVFSFLLCANVVFNSRPVKAAYTTTSPCVLTGGIYNGRFDPLINGGQLSATVPAQCWQYPFSTGQGCSYTITTTVWGLENNQWVEIGTRYKTYSISCGNSHITSVIQDRMNELNPGFYTWSVILWSGTPGNSTGMYAADSFMFLVQ